MPQCGETGENKKEKLFFKKYLQFEKRFDIIIKPKGHGRLAQLVEHLLDVQRVRDSSSLPSTTQGAQSSVLFFVLRQKETGERELESRKAFRSYNETSSGYDTSIL